MRVLITGGSGFVGQRLCQRLNALGHAVQVVSRTPHKVRERLPGCDIRDSAQAFIDAPPEAIVNLAGEPIAAKRWSATQKRRLLDSRLEATAQLVVLCQQLAANGQALPRVAVSGSAMGYYGDQGEREVREETPPHPEFAHRLCAEWEAAAKPLSELGIRLALLRTGLVFDAGGGSLEKMLPPFKLGLGARLGSGRQFMPWIHRDDLVEAIVFLLENEALAGPFNASAPHPVTNAEFTRTLAHTLKRPALFVAPAFVLKVALGEMSRLLLTGADMRPARLQAAGFTFRYPTLDTALSEILAR